MVEKRDEAIDLARRLAQRLAEADIRQAEVYLYGSWARGNPRAHSDIDMAVVSPDLPEDWFAAWSLLCRLRRDIDIRIDAVPLRPADFVDENPLAWEIKQHGVRVE
jgi:predicted nucleotidyltransferase